MARLIDADALIEAMEKVEEDYENMGSIPNWFTALRIIKEQPTAYDVDAVVAELDKNAEAYRELGFKNDRKGRSTVADKHYYKQTAYLHAIDIVKRGGVE